jgi:hypothetical protein
MKKSVRRLALSRETVRRLDLQLLNGVAGAFEEDNSQAGGCGSLSNTSNSCAHTCGTVCDIPTWHC